MKQAGLQGTFKSFRAVYLLIAMLVSNNALAVGNYWNISESDLRQLPPFCKYGFKRYGVSQKDVVWLNHLCPGLNALNHAKQMLGQNEEKAYALNRARAHFSYTIDHTSEDFPMRSAVFVNRGLVHEMQGNITAAIDDYQAAIQANPRQPHAYASMADLYIKLNKFAQARDIIERGLTVKPKSRKLLRRLAKLQEGTGDVSE